MSDIHLGDWGMPVAQILNYCYKNKLDIDEIIDTHLIKGKVVKRLILKR